MISIKKLCELIKFQIKLGKFLKGFNKFHIFNENQSKTGVSKVARMGSCKYRRSNSDITQIHKRKYSALDRNCQKNYLSLQITSQRYDSIERKLLNLLHTVHRTAGSLGNECKMHWDEHGSKFHSTVLILCNFHVCGRSRKHNE